MGQRPIVQSIVESASGPQIVVPPRRVIVQNVQRPAETIIPQMIMPQESLRSTVSVVPSPPIVYKQPHIPAKVNNYQSMNTPAHIIGSREVMAPNKITQFELPVRKRS